MSTSLRTLIIATLVLTSGCATMRQREAQDPGHGGRDYVLKQMSFLTQVACSTPEYAMRTAAHVVAERMKSSNE